MIKNSLNPEGHQNPISGSKVMAILLKWWILPISGALSGRVCACSPRCSFHQLGPLGRVGLVVTKSVCLSVNCPLPMRFFCVVGLVQSVPRPWTGAISISILSRALKTMLCSGVRSRSRSQSRVEP